MGNLDLGCPRRLGVSCVALVAAGLMAACGGSGVGPGNGSGSGALTCGSGQTACGSGSTSFCANLQTDNANCGSCGNPCAAGQACQSGTCKATCGGGQTMCGSGASAFCADLQTDNANCGSCGNPCTAGQACTGGTCEVTCGGVLSTCGTGATAYCANLSTDTAHCGTCETACTAGQVCAGGHCADSCGSTLASCTNASGPYCADTQNDDANCGACGVPCAASSACIGGTCCTPTTWYQDADGDGFGNPAVSLSACPQPTGYVADDTDCDDTNPNVYPGAPEICDGVKDDCSNASWTSDAGSATFVDTTGAVTDYTGQLTAGTAATPVNVALDAAGTLNVCAGTWYAGFTVGADVSIVGIGGRDAVILDGGSQQQLVTDASGATPYTVEVSGLTMTHGTTTGNGGAVSLLGGGTATLTDVAITASTATNGGGVYAASPLQLERVVVSGCSASDAGGGLLTVGPVSAAWLQITGNQATAAQNGAGDGGGWVIDSSVPVPITVTDLSVDRNSAVEGGGILVRGLASSPPTVTVTGGDISGNSVTRLGGGLWMVQGSVTLNDMTMVANRADTGTFSLTAPAFGGAANVAGGTLTLNGCTVQDNVDEFGSPPAVGGIYVNGTLQVNASHFGFNCIWLLSTHVCVTPSSTTTAADVVCGGSSNAYVFTDPATMTCTSQSCS